MTEEFNSWQMNTFYYAFTMGFYIPRTKVNKGFTDMLEKHQKSS